MDGPTTAAGAFRRRAGPLGLGGGGCMDHSAEPPAAFSRTTSRRRRSSSSSPGLPRRSGIGLPAAAFPRRIPRRHCQQRLGRRRLHIHLRHICSSGGSTVYVAMLFFFLAMSSGRCGDGFWVVGRWRTVEHAEAGRYVPHELAQEGGRRWGGHHGHGDRSS